MLTALWMLRLRLAPIGREEGQTLIEYALIAALVAVALVASLTALAGGIDAIFDTVIGLLGGSTAGKVDS